MRNQKSKLIDRFEKENGYFEQKHEKALKAIKVNRRAVAGQLPEREETVRANLILSTLQALLPHLFAKQPEVAINPAEKVNPVDGDVGDDIYHQANLFSETARILLKRVMMRAKLKKKARQAVRAAATTKLGIIKVSYRKDYYEDPVVKSEIQTAQAQLAKMQAIASNIDPESDDFRKLQQSIMAGRYEPEQGIENEDEIRRILSLIEAKRQDVRKLRTEGVHLSVIPLDKIRWDVSVSAEDIHDGAFISHYIFETVENAKARFKIVDDEKDKENSRVNKWKKFPSPEAEENKNDLTSDSKSKEYVKIWERWDAETSTVYTWIEGDYDLAKPEYHPQTFEDLWFPFFVLGLNNVDGNDLSISTVETLIPLMEEYEDTIDKKEEHRDAAIPFMMADKGRVNGEDLNMSFKRVGSRDVVLVDTNGAPLNSLFAPGPSVPLNERLYDTQNLLFEMQNVSGVGDAERGGIARAKTLGEAQIMQQGLATRTEDARDAVETWLTDIFRFAFGLCLREMSEHEVKRIAGEYAFWPALEDSAESFYSLVDVDIEAGSSGRPDKVTEQKTWFDSLEMLTSSVQTIMGLRKQGIPDDQNPMYRMFEESIRRLDERIDITSILPKTKVITSTEVVASIQQQLEELAQQNPQMAQMAAALVQQNPVINQVIQNQGQTNG